MAAKVLVRPSFWYWDRRNGGERKGIILLMTWMFSLPRHVAPYARFYKSCGWDALICHPHILNLFSPHRAASLALDLLNELAKDLEDQLHPVVISVFSGSPKACLYKFLQILQGKLADLKIQPGKFDAVGRCLVGLIFDSSPVDFVSELGTRLCEDQFIKSAPASSKAILSWGARSFSKTLDFLFISRFQQERVDLWRTLYSAVNIGPMLFLCSENDELAPIDTIYLFASNLYELGASLSLVSWEFSEHVGHFRLHPKVYKNSVTRLLEEAVFVYSKRMQLETKHMENHGSMDSTHAASDKAAVSWVVLPEATAEKIDALSKLNHFTGMKQDRAYIDALPFISRTKCEGSKQQPDSFFEEVEESDNDTICPYEEENAVEKGPETSSSPDSSRTPPDNLLKRNLFFKSRL